MEEGKIRYIVTEIAKDILELDVILETAGVSRTEYINLSETRAFRDTLASATAEWRSATNTPKRARLRAAAITEQFMLNLFLEARDGKDVPLSSKVKAFEAISRIAGLYTPDLIPAGASGNSFNLQINFSGGKTLNMELGSPSSDSSALALDEQTIEGELEGEVEDEVEEYYSGGISEIFVGDELEEL